MLDVTAAVVMLLVCSGRFGLSVMVDVRWVLVELSWSAI